MLLNCDANKAGMFLFYLFGHNSMIFLDVVRTEM